MSVSIVGKDAPKISAKPPSTLPLILVVEDDAITRRVIREALSASHYEVEEAGDGVEALNVLETRLPDVVLMDVNMPNMDGFTACATMRNLPSTHHTPILMVTARDDLTSINQAYNAGATDFIAKPINIPLLSYRVQYILRAHQAIEELRQSEARLAHAQQIAHLGNWEWNIQEQSFYCSKEIYNIFKLSRKTEPLSHEKFLEHIHHDDLVFVVDSREDAIQGRHAYNIEYRIKLQDGSIRTLHEQAEVIFNPQGQAVQMNATLQDVTYLRQTEERMRYLAYYDALTELPNRLLFHSLLEKAISNAERSHTITAVLHIDLDQFKRINDTLGHSVGDQLLKMVTDRLKFCVRDNDICSRNNLEPLNYDLARLGGDEFTVLLTNVAQPEDAAMVAQRILATLEEPINTGEYELVVTASIGIAIYPDDGLDVEALLKNADTALYQAKAAGRDNHKFYTDSMNATHMERLSLESSLHRAIENQELLLHFQPKVDINTFEVNGVEALIRWKHPKLGLVPPVTFIPLAEETGLIIPIGEWVLETACRQNKLWQREGLPAINMAVNLSSLQFTQSDLVSTVAKVLEKTQLDPSHLELELTESILMQNVAETIDTLKALKAMGVNLSVDDFGTGYSSLAYLTQFPLDTLKVDCSFVRNVHRDPHNAAITTAIISLAHTLSLNVIAEGVENDEQLKFLRKRQCNQIQGYIFSRPIDAAKMTKMLIDMNEVPKGSPLASRALCANPLTP